MEGVCAGSIEGEALVVTFGSPPEQVASNTTKMPSTAWRVAVKVWHS